MKLVAGSILTLTSAVFFLARIQAQPMNFQEAITFSIRCSIGFSLAGIALIVWGLLEDRSASRRQAAPLKDQK